MACCWRLPLVYLAPPPAVQSGHAHPDSRPAPDRRGPHPRGPLVRRARVRGLQRLERRRRRDLPLPEAARLRAARASTRSARQGFHEHTTRPRPHPDPALGRVGAQLRPRVPRRRVRARRRRRRGRARLAELEASHGPLPPTLRTDTAHGAARLPALARRACRGPSGSCSATSPAGAPASGAGYVIGPRSVHASGAVYAPAGPFTRDRQAARRLGRSGRRASARGRGREASRSHAGTSCPSPATTAPATTRSATTSRAATGAASPATRSGRASSPSLPPGSPSRSPSPSSGSASSGRGRTRPRAWANR